MSAVIDAPSANAQLTDELAWDDDLDAMKTQRMAYVSHPIGYDEAEVQANLVNAREWIRFLIEHTKWALCCPWFTYRVVLPLDLQGRALVDQLTILQRCDLVVLCGGMLSSHMQQELEMAKRRNIAIVDLTPLGYDPPTWDAEHRERIAMLVAEAFNAVASAHV